MTEMHVVFLVPVPVHLCCDKTDITPQNNMAVNSQVNASGMFPGQLTHSGISPSMTAGPSICMFMYTNVCLLNSRNQNSNFPSLGSNKVLLLSPPGTFLDLVV